MWRKISRLQGAGTLRRAVRWIRQADALILMYHRVSDSGPDPWGLAVSPRHFAEHLQVLRRYASPAALRQLLRRRVGSSPPMRVVLTFDDGYADNAMAALPSLRAHDVPATVFVTTGLLGKTRAFWWDELADLFLRPGHLPDTLELTVRGRDFYWSLGPSAKYDEQAYTSHRRWSAMMEEAPTERQAIYLALWELMLPLPDDDQRFLLDTLVAWSGTRPSRTATHRTLSEGELQRLASDDLVEIGAHSVTHADLLALHIDAQRREIAESKRVLESLIGKPVGSFSYPYGRASEQTRSLVCGAGFDRACSTRAARVTPRTNPFDLPRLSVPDCDGEQFARMLNHAFE